MPDPLETRRKKLRHQSWYRGCKETDTLLGRYADHLLPSCDAEDIESYTRLLDEDDRDIWLWVSGQQPVPDAHQPLIESIRRFQQNRFA